MSWKDNLLPASFRGVPFKVENEEGTFGRRVQIHEYPNRDKPFVEDLGRATRKFTVSAYVVGDDFINQRDALIVAIEEVGPGKLVHPYYGEMNISINGEVRVSHSTAEGRMCRLDFQVVESGELTFPTAGMATKDGLLAACAVFDEFMADVFGVDFNLTGLADFIQNDVLANVNDMIDFITGAIDFVDSAVAAASRLLKGDLSVILMPPSVAMDFVNKVQRMWRAGRRLDKDSNSLVKSIKGLTGVTFGNDLAPRGVWKTDSKTIQTTVRQSNAVAQLLRLSAISESAKLIASLPQTTQPLNPQTPKTDRPFISHSVVSDIDTGTTVNVVTYEDLAVIREELNAAIDRELIRVTDDQLFVALNKLRASINRDISARLAQVEKTVVVVIDDVLPALVIAADRYDSAARESDITGRNAIKHPGFIPVSEIRVPIR